MTDDLAMISSLTDLNDDCLRRIFLYVPATNRIKLRRVCKRFRQVSDDCWHSVKRLTIMDDTLSAAYGAAFGSDKIRSKEDVIELEKGLTGIQDYMFLKTTNTRLTEGVMKRCAEYLTFLHDFRLSKTDSVLSLATKHCRRLEKLMMSVVTKAEDKQLNQLLSANKKLKAFDFESCFKNIKVCVRAIPTEFLEKLRIDTRDMRPPPLMLMIQKQIVRKARFLKNLNFNDLDDELVELIGKKIKLKVLKLETFNADYLTKTGLNPVLNLRNLRELSISFPEKCEPVCHHELIRAPVDDDFLTKLAENLLLLEKLAFEAPAGVTDEGFARLASLPKLTRLCMISCDQITDEHLLLFDKIEVLGLIECNIRDGGVIKFLEKSQVIRQLNLERSHITNKSLVAAVQATKKRDNGVRLFLFVNKTKTAPQELTETSPLLEIVVREKTGKDLFKSSS